MGEFVERFQSTKVTMKLLVHFIFAFFFILVICQESVSQPVGRRCNKNKLNTRQRRPNIGRAEVKDEPQNKKKDAKEETGAGKEEEKADNTEDELPEEEPANGEDAAEGDAPPAEGEDVAEGGVGPFEGSENKGSDDAADEGIEVANEGEQE